MAITVTPAYGRDYRSGTAARADWNANKDFIEATSGRYINKRDAGDLEVRIRYGKLRKQITAVEGSA